MIRLTRALPELSFAISIIMLRPAVTKLLASKVAFWRYGQAMATASGPNEQNSTPTDGESIEIGLL